MWIMQTNFLVFDRRKLDFEKVLCDDAQLLALHMTSFVGYLGDGIFDPKEFPLMGRVSVFGIGCFEAKCFPKVFHEVWCISSGRNLPTTLLILREGNKGNENIQNGFLLYRR